MPSSKSTERYSLGERVTLSEKHWKTAGVITEIRFDQITIRDDKTKETHTVVAADHVIFKIHPLVTRAVKSASSPDHTYHVREFLDADSTCSCPGFLVWTHCKHLGRK